VGKPGNLFLTVVLPVARIPLPLSLVPLRVGVVVAEAIAATTQVSVHLKWPNDVLVKQEKVSGVLIEGDGGKS
jgi:biotin-(acetyl-CoA carboxylase) ligase